MGVITDGVKEFALVFLAYCLMFAYVNMAYRDQESFYDAW